MWNMDIFHFFNGIFVIFIWKWERCMLWVMLLIFYNFVKLLKKGTLSFNMHSQPMKKKRLEHIFWSHSHSFDWYQKCGDVIVFYTTYKVNAYDMSFGIFVGVNNHGKTILFGCALLRNETTSVFRWLMKVLYLSYNCFSI